jgi:hypothetical protein
MTNEENPLDYFKNLTSDPSDHIMSLQDMEKTIKFHEDELAAEDKRVEGTDEYPNYGDDFADMVYIARRLLDHVNTQKQEIEQLRAERDEARREAMSWISDQACRFEDVDEEYKKRGWEYLKENTDA